MVNISNYWELPPDDQAKIREEYPCYTDEEEQAFLNALFPAFGSFEEADEVYNLSETSTKDTVA